MLDVLTRLKIGGTVKPQEIAGVILELIDRINELEKKLNERKETIPTNRRKTNKES